MNDSEESHNKSPESVSASDESLLATVCDRLGLLTLHELEYVMEMAQGTHDARIADEVGRIKDTAGGTSKPENVTIAQMFNDDETKSKGVLPC